MKPSIRSFVVQLASDVISLSNLDVVVRGKGVVTVQELLDSQDVTLLLFHLPLVHSAAAVIGLSNSSRLIHVENSVEFCVISDEVKLLVFVTIQHVSPYR